MIISELISQGSSALKKNKILTHLLDSELILSHVLKKSREQILIKDNSHVLKSTVNSFIFL